MGDVHSDSAAGIHRSGLQQFEADDMVDCTLTPSENTRRLHHHLHPQRIAQVRVREHIQRVATSGRVDIDSEGQLESCGGGIEGHLGNIAWDEHCVGTSELSTRTAVQLSVVAPYEVASIAGLATAERRRLRVRCRRCRRFLAKGLEFPAARYRWYIC